MVTDPPYGVGYDATWRYKAGVSTKDGAFGKSANDDTSDWQAAYALFPGRIAYVWMSSLALPVAASGLDACGFIRRSLIIWDKGHIVIGRGHYHWRHETCWYAVRKGAQAHWAATGKPRPSGRLTTPGNPRPATRPKSPLSVCSEPSITTRGDVYDPFVGSGTTVIAGEQEGRSVYALEIDPAYVDVTVKRWEDFTGRKAKRKGRQRHGKDQTPNCSCLKATDALSSPSGRVSGYVRMGAERRLTISSGRSQKGRGESRHEG